MNNEVLRRKLFKRIEDMDARRPTGILASSPEMIDVVEKRANGGGVTIQDTLRDFANLIGGPKLKSAIAVDPVTQPNLGQNIDQLRMKRDAESAPFIPVSETRPIDEVLASDLLTDETNYTVPASITEPEVKPESRERLESSLLQSPPEEVDIATPKPRPTSSDQAIEGLKTLSDEVGALRTEPETGKTDTSNSPNIDALTVEIPKRASLSEISKKAEQLLGFKQEDIKSDKGGAFWRNLTMAGLAMAAGESSNALTNVAKGLMFGMDAYSKDVKEMTARDDAMKAEYRATMRDLIKTEDDRRMAEAGLTNNFNMAIAQLRQNKDQFESNLEFRKEESRLRNELGVKQLEVSIAQQIAGLGFQERGLELQEGAAELQRDQYNFQQEQFTFEKARAVVDDVFKERALDTEFMKNMSALGYAKRDPDNGKFQWTKTGEQWKKDNTAVLTNYLLDISSATQTDTQRANAGIAAVIEGNPTDQQQADALNSRLGTAIASSLGTNNPGEILDAIAAVGDKAGNGNGNGNGNGDEAKKRVDLTEENK